MENGRNVILTRKQLYDEIWALSATKVAEKYNLDYNKLKAVCKSENIPLPSRANWMKRKMGKELSDEIVAFSGAEDTEISLIKKDAVIKRVRKIAEEGIFRNKTETTFDWPDEILDYLDEAERNKVLTYARNLQVDQNVQLHKALLRCRKDAAEYRAELEEAKSKPYYNPRFYKPENGAEFFKEVSDEGVILHKE